jgi:hypothetical protein
MNHTAQNSLKASAYLLGLSVEELINVLHNASKVQEIRTASGCPFVLPAREGKEESLSEVCQSFRQRRRVDTDCFEEPNYANPDECKRAVTQLKDALHYWQIEAKHWHGCWLNQLQRNEETRK